MNNQPCLALRLQEANVQVNGGSKQHITANFVKKGLIRGEQAEQKEVKGTEQGCRSEGGKTNIHPRGRQREALQLGQSPEKACTLCSTQLCIGPCQVGQLAAGGWVPKPISESVNTVILTFPSTWLSRGRKQQPSTLIP